MYDPVKFLKSQAWKDFSILLLILGILTLVFRFTDLDIRLEHLFYTTDKGWMLQYRPFWDFIYRYGIFPGYILAFCGLIMISVSYWHSRYLKFRKASFVLIFTIIAGPGILVNLVLKDHTGRPRPREITEFGGSEQYLCVCETGRTNEGKSFPCGHCSMGFYLAVPWLFYRNRKKILAYSILGIGIGYGILIGIARMMAGGHFASDVVWAGGLTWFVALIGYYLFRPDKPPKVSSLTRAEHKKRAHRATLITGILLPVITIGLMLATPYFSKKYIDVSSSQLKALHCRVVEVDLNDADVIINPGNGFHLDYKINAFGFPNSKIRGLWTPGDTSRYIIQNMGWFTEITNDITIVVPSTDSISWYINVNRGKIICNLNGDCKADLHFSIKKGDLLIHSQPNALILIGKQGQIVNKNSWKPRCFQRKPVNQEGNVIAFDLRHGSVFIE
jgi:membrane-associated PAP2 superfamily phosphatase